MGPDHRLLRLNPRAREDAAYFKPRIGPAGYYPREQNLSMKDTG